jgi:hypothetical protein
MGRIQSVNDTQYAGQIECKRTVKSMQLLIQGQKKLSSI